MTDALPRKFGRFELLECVSQGGMAEVYRARALGGSRVFALKKLPRDAATEPRLSAMFLDEGLMAASVSGPNLVRLVEHGDEGTEHYLLFEWIEGVTLEELLAVLEARGQRMPVDQAARLFARIAEALERLHASVDAEGQPTNMVHRDLSPGNVIIDLEGEPTIVDFGLSRSRLQRTRTEPGFVKGKLGYLAPEQLDGHADVRTDVFALGLCFYETLTGTRLFDKPTLDASMEALRRFGGVQSVRPLRPDVHEALDEVVSGMLAARMEDRYASAGDVRRAIYGSKPGILLSGEDLDEANGALLQHLFPARAEQHRRAIDARAAERALRRTPVAAPAVDRSGGRIASLVILVLIVVLSALVAAAALFR